MTKTFQACDDLEHIPQQNAENYRFETDYLIRTLPQHARVVQVGSMDGRRALALYAGRPDLKIIGLEIESELVEIAQKNAAEHADSISFVRGDVTRPGDIPECDYVVCLNNTLGYIPDRDRAITEMRKSAKAIISVYGEVFDWSLACDYFVSLGTDVIEFSDIEITTKDLGTIHRFTKEEVVSWGAGELVQTPIGYLVRLSML